MKHFCCEAPGSACVEPRVRIPIAPAAQFRALEMAEKHYLLQLRASGRSPMTVASYAESLNLLTQVLGPKTSLADVSADGLHAAIAELAHRGGRSVIRRSETTLNRHRSAYRAFFNWAFQTGRTAVNPALLLRLSKAQSIPAVPIRTDEVSLLLSTIRRSGEPLSVRDEALFATYAFAGLRRMEAVLLNVSDHDFERSALRVRIGKGRRPRVVPLVHHLNLLLSRFRETRLESTGVPTGTLFSGRSPDTGLTPRQVQRRFEYWKTASGLRPILTIHSFRAGFATALHRHSRDVVLVSRALGHKDIRTTLRYIDPSAPKLAQALEATFAACPHL